MIKDSGNSSMASKRSSLLVPDLKFKAISRPEPSMSDLRNEAIRIIKKLPAGNTATTLWAIMQYLDMSDIRLLCKYKKVKTVGQKTKQDIGQSLLYSFQSGEFKSIFQSIEDEKIKNKSGKKKATLQAPKEQSSLNDKSIPKDIHVNNDIKDIQVNKVESAVSSSVNLRIPTPTPTPTPVVAVGESDQWRLVDDRKLLIN
jgi:hypothetical protein